MIHLNQAHYDDIIEERSIVKLCGYPLCNITLGNIPKQQYIIASSQNKVYDITERKKFCSNKCYKSSVYLKEQILTTPLWVRKDDDIIPEFKLLLFDDDEKLENLQREDSQQDKIVKQLKETLIGEQQGNEKNQQLGANDTEIDKQKPLDIEQSKDKSNTS